jgi:hypothetical protein
MIEFESSLDRLGIVEEEPLPHAKWSPEERVWFGAEYVGKNMNAITAPPEQLQRRSEYAYLATSQAALEVKAFVLDLSLREIKGYATSDWQPVTNTTGWSFYDDTKIKHKPGWICDLPTAGESITFLLPLEPRKTGYNVGIGFLRSYENMGKLKVTGTDTTTGKKQSKEFDSLWLKKISIYNEEVSTAS